MPGTETKHKVRDVTVRMLRGGSGPPLLFLHGANGLPVWLPVFDLLSKNFEVFVPEHPGFGTSDNPPWMRNIGDLAMYYLDFIDGLERASGPSGRPVARRLGRGRGRGAQLHAAEIAVAARRRPASASRACRPATTSSGTPRSRSAISTTTRQSPIRCCRCSSTDEQADIMLTNRFAATKFGWEPRWYNPSLERWLHRITVPTLIVWGKDDKLFPSAYAARWGERIPDSRVEIVPECGHVPAVEKPEITAKEISRLYAGTR